jgi:hypothetical protein
MACIGTTSPVLTFYVIIIEGSKNTQKISIEFACFFFVAAARRPYSSSLARSDMQYMII